jgi:hypothetical protein
MVSVVLKWIFGNLTLDLLNSQLMLAQLALIIDVKELNAETMIKVIGIKVFAIKMVAISTLIDTKKILEMMPKTSLEKVETSRSIVLKKLLLLLNS